MAPGGIKTRLTRLDALVFAGVLAAAAFIVVRARTNLGYQWDWGAMPQYLVRDSPEAGWTPGILGQGLITTVKLTLWTGLFASVLGVAAGLMRNSRSLFLRMISGTYVESMRNLPPLVLVFLFYFFVSEQILPAWAVSSAVKGLPPALQGLLSAFFAPPARLSNFLAALLTLSLYEGAYIAEIVRAGVQSIERGQWEAARALGLTRFQEMRHVIGPQAFARVVPPLAGQFISIIKDSAIVSVISIQELTYAGMQLMSSTHMTFEVWTTVLILYMVLTLACSLLARRVELRLRLPGRGA